MQKPWPAIPISYRGSRFLIVDIALAASAVAAGVCVPSQPARPTDADAVSKTFVIGTRCRQALAAFWYAAIAR